MGHVWFHALFHPRAPLHVSVVRMRKGHGPFSSFLCECFVTKSAWVFRAERGCCCAAVLLASTNLRFGFNDLICVSFSSSGQFPSVARVLCRVASCRSSCDALLDSGATGDGAEAFCLRASCSLLRFCETFRERILTLLRGFFG